LKSDPTELTGLNLIEKVLEFEEMTPDKSQWSFTAQKDNLPRLVRLQQLKVLLQVFTPETFDPQDIACGLDKLLNGSFVLFREETQYYDLFKRMETVIQTAKSYPTEMQKSWTVDHLKRNYTNMLGFKKSVNQVLNHNKGILEISYPYLYPLIITQEISKNLDTSQIDDFLRLVIDPLDRTFSKEKLIQEYDYPPDDVYDIDLDCW